MQIRFGNLIFLDKTAQCFLDRWFYVSVTFRIQNEKRRTENLSLMEKTNFDAIDEFQEFYFPLRRLFSLGSFSTALKFYFPVTHAFSCGVSI